jgi:hypothetical protein
VRGSARTARSMAARLRDVGRHEGNPHDGADGSCSLNFWGSHPCGSPRPATTARSSPDARQAIKITRRRRDRHGRWSGQTFCAITSLDVRAADPALLACCVRGRKAIKARLHWVRDVTFSEDRRRVCTDHGPTNLACLCTLRPTPSASAVTPTSPLACGNTSERRCCR